jgi:hypothetical protein
MKDAATPERFTNDFVSTVLQVKGGTGSALPPFMKKIGLVNTDGTPSPLYDRFRNDGTSGAALAEAARTGYKALYSANEYAHKLGDKELKGLVLQVTGLQKDNRVAQLVSGTFKKLCSYASFDAAAVKSVEPKVAKKTDDRIQLEVPAGKTLGLSYTINLQLPATTNVEVFNAIFKSLRENLLDE